MKEETREKIRNIMDYLYGMKRDIEMFFKEYGKNSGDDKYKRVSSNILARLKYQLEQAQKMLKEIIGDEDDKA